MGELSIKGLIVSVHILSHPKTCLLPDSRENCYINSDCSSKRNTIVDER